jgi:ubiquinone/menaquinone biosynthesis C-methylase UbiE
MSSVQADFDRLALLDSEGWTANNHYHNYLLGFVPPNCVNALEVGCGTGAFSRRLAERAKSVVGLDLSPEMIRVARSRSRQFSNIHFEVADAMAWNPPVAHFECITSIATFHHLRQRELLLKLREALRPGGVLIVLDLVASNSPLEMLQDMLAIGVSSAQRLIHNRSLRPPAEVRAAWEQHGQHDDYLSMTEVRKLCAEVLTGAIVRRHLLWRYSLVYQKPDN